MSESRKVVVLGTGGAGLTAAIAAHDFGAEVEVLEKADKVGGTTAWSGGMVWIQAGVADSREEAVTYLLSMSHGLIERHLAEAFVDAGPQMVRHLCERTPVQFRTIQHFPDYHAEFPGGKTGGGRSFDTPPYSFLELGEWEQRVTPSPYYPDPRLSIYDTPLGQAVPAPVPEDELARRSVRHERASGQALIGRLLAALENGSEGIRVVGIAPGPIDTPMLRSRAGNEWPPAIVAVTPLARIGEPVEIANAILWLCSDEASYISGATLPVDGGFLAP